MKFNELNKHSKKTTFPHLDRTILIVNNNKLFEHNCMGFFAVKVSDLTWFTSCITCIHYYCFYCFTIFTEEEVHGKV